MLALYSADPKQVPRLRSALRSPRDMVAVTDWDQFQRVLPGARCSVVHVDHLDTACELPRLSAMRARHPRHPVVLVTRWDLENARHLKDVSVEEVIWMPEVDRGLRPAVDRACSRTPNPVHCLALVFESAEHLPRGLREALAHACRSEQPVRSVNELATAAGRNRRTLWHQWNRTLGGTPGLRLQDFLHWLLLLRALAAKTPERSWASVAEALKLSPQTLWRYARDLTGRTLPALEEAEGEVLSHFQDSVLRALLGEQPLDILEGE